MNDLHPDETPASRFRGRRIENISGSSKSGISSDVILLEGWCVEEVDGPGPEAVPLALPAAVLSL